MSAPAGSHRSPSESPALSLRLRVRRAFYPRLGNNGVTGEGAGMGGGHRHMNTARRRADRVAAAVGCVIFALGIAGVVVANTLPTTAPSTIETTVVSSPIPGDPVTMTVQSTTPPTRPTLPPRVTQEVTTTEGAGPGSVVVTTSPARAPEPFLGSVVANITFEVILVTVAALLLAFAAHRLVLGSDRPGRLVASGAAEIDVAEASEVKKLIHAATEAADLSRPLFDKTGVPDARLRLLESRITLEQEVRSLAQNHDLPAGLTVPYVVRGLVEKRKMSPKFAAAVTELSDIGDRLSRGAKISIDATTLLAEAYAGALARLGGKTTKR